MLTPQLVLDKPPCTHLARFNETQKTLERRSTSGRNHTLSPSKDSGNSTRNSLEIHLMRLQLPATRYQRVQRRTLEFQKSSPGVSAAQAVCSLAVSWHTPTKPAISGWRTTIINLAQPSGLSLLEITIPTITGTRAKVIDALTREKAQ